METATQCAYCGRPIVNEHGGWVDPDAAGDDIVWRDSCDSHDTFTAEHSPTVDIAEVLDALTGAAYGAPAVYELPNGASLRAVIDIDYDTQVTDFDVYGTFAWSKDRPAGMDGNAEKLAGDHGVSFWWQPPSDVPRTDPMFGEFRQMVREIVEYGFVIVSVEYCDGTDAYGRHIARHVRSLGGIECTADDEYRRAVIDELVAELDVAGIQ